jgi:hypothetical protein
MQSIRSQQRVRRTQLLDTITTAVSELRKDLGGGDEAL